MGSVQREELDEIIREVAEKELELTLAKTDQSNSVTVENLTRQIIDLQEKACKLMNEMLRKQREACKLIDEMLRKQREDEEKLRREYALTSTEWFKQDLQKLPCDFNAGYGMRNTYWDYAPLKVKNWNDFEEQARQCCDSVRDSRTFRCVRVGLELFVASHRLSIAYFLHVLHEMAMFYPGDDFRIFHSPVISEPPSSLTGASKEAWILANPASLVIPHLMVKKGSDYCFVAEMIGTGTFRKSLTDTLPNLASTYTNDPNDHDETHSLIHSEILQHLMKYFVTQRLGYGVVSTADVSYFVRRVDSEVAGNFNCLEISNGITWDSKDPTLLESLYYVFDRAVKEMSIYQTYDYSQDDSAPRRKLSTRSSGNRDLLNTDAANLHLDNAPYASGGASGNVVLGVVRGQRVAVKLAPLDSYRGKALLNEAEAYIKLRKCWGQFTPKLVDYGTTAHGKVFYVATEFIDGSTIDLKPLTQKVARRARRALQAIHVSGMLHGDIHAENILVVGRGVRFIDFGFARSITSTEECMREREKLDDIILRSTKSSK